MDIPYRDWQFWATTAVFLLAVAWLLRGVLPIPWLSKRAKARRTRKNVSLTVGGKPAQKPR